jgi:hypothetical protein
MIQRFEGLLAVSLAIPIERSHVCFLLGIHAFTTLHFFSAKW